MNLRTLHFTNSWHATSGGIATFYRALLGAADAQGWHAHLVVPSVSDSYEPIGPTTGIYHVQAPQAPRSPGYRVLYPHTYLLPNGPIRQILQQEKPDLVEICDKFTLPYLGGMLRTGLLASEAGRPTVVGLSCERAEETLTTYSDGGSLARRFANAYMKCIYFPMFDHHIAVSRQVADELELAARGHKVRRGVWIRGMGVDSELFHPRRADKAIRDELRALAQADEKTVLLLYAGRLAAEKNLTLLTEVLGLLQRQPRDFKLLIAGDGPQRDAFLREAEQHYPGALVYLGHIKNRSRLADIMANADIFLHPNPGEPYGIAPLEAMAAGIPLIAPDSGGVLTYANSSNAWVVPPTPEAFSRALWSILNGPEESEARKRRGRAIAEQLHWPTVCAGFLALYRDLHARATGMQWNRPQEPAFYSTPGDWFGFETSPTVPPRTNISR